MNGKVFLTESQKNQWSLKKKLRDWLIKTHKNKKMSIWQRYHGQYEYSDVRELLFIVLGVNNDTIV